MSLDPITKAYRDGVASSTELLDGAMHESGAADKTEKLDWHRAPETLDQARQEAHDEPEETARQAAEKLAELAITKAADKGTLALLAKVGGKPMATALEYAMNPQKIVTKPLTQLAVKTAAGVGAAEMALAAAGVATIGAAVRNVQLGDKLRQASDVVAMDLAATSLLDLDGDFQSSVYRHYAGSIAPDSVMAQFKKPDGSLTDFGRRNLPKLQSACDAGRGAALQAVYCDDPKAFLDANPKLKDRLEHDIAFSKGWDEVMFLKNQPGAAQKLDAVEQHVKANDGWSSAQTIPVRG